MIFFRFPVSPITSAWWREHMYQLIRSPNGHELMIPDTSESSPSSPAVASEVSAPSSASSSSTFASLSLNPTAAFAHSFQALSQGDHSASPTFAGFHTPLPGELFRNPNLAASMRRLAQLGPEEGFYQGPTAEAIVELVKSQGGVMELEVRPVALLFAFLIQFVESYAIALLMSSGFEGSSQ
jgi:hypothetical protein